MRVAVAILVAMSLAMQARAQDVEACERAARESLPVVASGRAFLLERESHVVEHRLARDGCVAFLAFGSAGVRDVDLLAHTTSGDVIEEDVEPRAWGWVRACGDEGLVVAAVAHVHAGRGEVRVLAIDDGPERAPELGREVGACFARSAGRGRPLTDAGEAPAMRSLERAIDDADARAIGWRAVGAAARGWLDPGATELHRVAIDRAGCHRIDAIGGPDVRALSLVVIGADGREIARDDRRRRDASVVLCPGAAGSVVVQVQARAGTGAYALRHRVVEGEPLDEARVDPRASVESVELAATLRARGMTPRAIAWGLADGRGAQAFEVEAGAGCVAIAALRSRELEGGDLDVRVADAQGRLVGWDEGAPSVDRGPIPVVWSCADDARTLRVEVRAQDATGRFLLVTGAP
ncbi:hypothetical protein [Sandaracinus amylolyticus]|uniref:Uncharacterized protein n=1 Tax=Sandaracinus amylolyticus TaxID=927083 RepID=A0A0F6YJB6_9BACT|nr:hypothetical protein [Sandaracinus amylolyticus]AKF06822.1 hypothetical protein DB32_003971 [Sandaracinus amylolyticus]